MIATAAIGLIGRATSAARTRSRCRASARVRRSSRGAATLVADCDENARGRHARALGFATAPQTGARSSPIPSIDVVDICTPNHLHARWRSQRSRPASTSTARSRWRSTAAEAAAIVEAARRAKVCNVIGFNYICNPMLQIAREMIAAGELGEVVGFRGSYLEDYMADPAVPYSWRCQRRLAGPGALADLGSHLINMGHFLLGADRARQCADLRRCIRSAWTVHAASAAASRTRTWCRRMVEFARRSRQMEISRIATGYKCGLAVRSARHARHLLFDQERMNELKFYCSADPAGRRGFRTILAGPEHADYAAVLPCARARPRASTTSR